MRRPHPSFIRCTRGDVFVEFAIALPVLIALMVGVIDFGWANSNLATAQKSLRNATRYLAVLPAEAICGSTPWGLGKAKKLAVYGSLDHPLISGWSESDVSLNPMTCEDWPTAPPRIVWLEADVEHKGLLWKLIGITGPLTMHASHQERWIGD